MDKTFQAVESFSDCVYYRPSSYRCLWRGKRVIRSPVQRSVSIRSLLSAVIDMMVLHNVHFFGFVLAYKVILRIIVYCLIGD